MINSTDGDIVWVHVDASVGGSHALCVPLGDQLLNHFNAFLLLP